MAILVATDSMSANVALAGNTAASATTVNSASKKVSPGTPASEGRTRGSRCSTRAQLQDNVHVAQAPPQPTGASCRAPVLCAADAATALALCQHPAATVLTAPITHTTMTTKPVCGRADSA